MTKEPTIREILENVLNPLLNLKTEYSSEFGKTCLVCGFPIDINKRKEIIDSALSSLLALIEKKFPKERSHKDSCDYEAWSCTCGATEYNEAISEIRSQFK